MFFTTDEEDEELGIEAKRALAYLQIKRNFRYVEFIAQGGFGWVSLVYDVNNKRPLAVKCTTDTTEMEVDWWPRLRHPNILPLLEHITLDNCTVFIMPAMRKDLWKCINEPQFYCEEISFGLCRIWLRDVATALSYLHSQHLCHLDLKLDNVFLKDDGYACLGDFSLLSDINEVPAGFHFLELYEPPEYTIWCHNDVPSAIKDATSYGGDKADMWQYGILALDLLTDLRLSRKSSELTMWRHDVWPVLQKILLHKEYLDYLLEKTFETVLFTDDEFSGCHEFLSGLLCLCPDERTSAEEAAKHEFVNVPWPSLPEEFELPQRVAEYRSEPLPLPIEASALEARDSGVKELLPQPSIGAANILERRIMKMQGAKEERRGSIAAVAVGNRPVEVKPVAPQGKLVLPDKGIRPTPKPLTKKIAKK